MVETPGFQQPTLSPPLGKTLTEQVNEVSQQATQQLLSGILSPDQMSKINQVRAAYNPDDIMIPPKMLYTRLSIGMMIYPYMKYGQPVPHPFGKDKVALEFLNVSTWENTDKVGTLSHLARVEIYSKTEFEYWTGLNADDPAKKSDKYPGDPGFGVTFHLEKGLAQREQDIEIKIATMDLAPAIMRMAYVDLQRECLNANVEMSGDEIEMKLKLIDKRAKALVSERREKQLRKLKKSQDQRDAIANA